MGWDGMGWAAMRVEIGGVESAMVLAYVGCGESAGRPPACQSLCPMMPDRA